MRVATLQVMCVCGLNATIAHAQSCVVNQTVYTLLPFSVPATHKLQPHKHTHWTPQQRECVSITARIFTRLGNKQERNLRALLQRSSPRMRVRECVWFSINYPIFILYHVCVSTVVSCVIRHRARHHHTPHIATITAIARRQLKIQIHSGST